MQLAEHSGDDFQVDGARVSRGLVLINQGGSQRPAGFALLAQYREAHLRHGYAKNVARTADTEIAKEKARTGDVDGAIQLACAVVDYTFDAGDALSLGEATRTLVEALLQRGTSADLNEAQAAIDRLAAEPTCPGFVLFEVPLLRLAGPAGAGSRRCRDLCAVPGSLPRHGENAWLRRTYRLGRGDAVTARCRR